jgi:hypothetical protein
MEKLAAEPPNLPAGENTVELRGRFETCDPYLGLDA